MGEKLRLLRDVFLERHLLLPALFFFLWQVGRTQSSCNHILHLGS